MKYIFYSTAIFEDRYSAPGIWFQNMARITSKMSGMNRRYSIESMYERLDDLSNEHNPIKLENLGNVFGGDSIINDVYYHDGIWLNVLADGSIMYSYDTESWMQTSVITSTGTVLCNLAYANNIWMGSSANGAIVRSYDGINWTTSSSLTSTNISKIVYGNNSTWCAMDDNAGIYYSTDNGLTWQLSNVTEICNTIIYDDIWVAVTNTAGYWYSVDGITWIQSNITTSSDDACVLERVGRMYYIYASNDGVYYSEDGKTWTQSKLTYGGDFAYYNGIYILACNNNIVYYSEDGKTWTQSNIIDKACDSPIYF